MIRGCVCDVPADHAQQPDKDAAVHAPPSQWHDPTHGTVMVRDQIRTWPTDNDGPMRLRVRVVSGTGPGTADLECRPDGSWTVCHLWIDRRSDG